MRTRSKLLLAGLTATIVLGAAVSTAYAGNLSVSEAGVRIVWTPLSLEAAGQVIACPVTLEGTFHRRSIVKRRGALIGAITRAIVRGGRAAGECTGGTATALTNRLPWHITYEGF